MTTSAKGFQAQGVYSNAGGNIGVFLALLGDPDVTNTVTGAPYLDEMAPGCNSQIRAEIAAMSVQGIASKSGVYVVTAGDVTATQSDILTGLAYAPSVPTAVDGTSIVEVWRSGVNVTRDAAVTGPAVGTLRVKSGASTYVLTAGDIVKYHVR